MKRKAIDNHARGWRGIHKPTPVSIPGWLKLIRRLNRMARNWGWSLCLLTVPVLAHDNPQDVVTEQVDVVELNHFYDESGRLVFDQIIFYDWSPCCERHQVRAWRLVKCRSQIPVRDWDRGGHVATWHDGEVLRSVRAQTCRETWTQYDPELVEREILSKDKRRELTKRSTP
jgi:hypothetical protein